MLVYKYTCVYNNKSYIGWTSHSLLRRWQSHVYASFNPSDRSYETHIHRAIRKHGVESFRKEILRWVYTTEEAHFFEKFYVRMFDSFHHGYNETAGGEGTVGLVPWNLGITHSPEARKKISEKTKGKKRKPFSETTRLRMSKAQMGNQKAKGVVRSPIWRQRLALASLGRKHSEETKKKIGELRRQAHARKRTELAATN